MDQVEKARNRLLFWYFLSNQPGGSEPYRILVDLVAREEGFMANAEHDAYGNNSLHI